MSKRFGSAEELISALQAAGTSKVQLECRVATVTAAGGGRLVFRGRVCISAVVAGEHMEYQQELEPRRVVVGADPMPTTEQSAGEVGRAQRELMRQIRLYREQYQPVVAAGRKAAAQRLHCAGIAVVEPV